MNQALEDSHGLQADNTSVLSIPMTDETRVLLGELIKLDGESVEDIVNHALMAYWTQRLNAASRQAIASLRADPQAWQAYREDAGVLDGTLADGLDDESEDA